MMDTFSGVGVTPPHGLDNGANALLSLATAARSAEDASGGAFASHHVYSAAQQLHGFPASGAPHFYQQQPPPQPLEIPPQEHQPMGLAQFQAQGRQKGFKSGAGAGADGDDNMEGLDAPVPKTRTLLQLPNDRALTKEVAFELLAEGAFPLSEGKKMPPP